MRTDQNIRKALFVAVAACAGLLAQNSATEAEVAFDGSKARVNLSNKLEMLTQTIGSASCRLSAGIGAEAAAKELQTARNDFNTIMNGLEQGSMALGIPSPEKYSVVLNSIEDVRAAIGIGR